MKKILSFILAVIAPLCATEPEISKPINIDYQWKSEENALHLGIKLDSNLQFVDKYDIGFDDNKLGARITCVPTTPNSIYKDDGFKLQEIVITVLLSNVDDQRIDVVTEEVLCYRRFGWFKDTESKITSITTTAFPDMSLNCEKDPIFTINHSRSNGTLSFTKQR